MKNTFVTGVLMTMATLSFGQDRFVNLAQESFNDLEFAQSAELYNYLLDKKNGQQISDVDLRNAAVSNWNINAYARSFELYEQLLKRESHTVQDEIACYNIALYLGKTEQAKILANQLKVKAVDLKKFSNYDAEWTYLESLKSDSVRFGVQRLKINSKQDDCSPVFFNDGLIFSSNRDRKILQRKNLWDLQNFSSFYFAKGFNESFDNPLRVKKEFFSKFHEGNICFAKKGEIAFVTQNDLSERQPKSYVKRVGIYIYTKNGNAWSKPVSFSFNSRDYNVGHPTISEDGNTLYFVSDKPGGFGGADIYISTLIDGKWSEPINAGKNINTDGDESFPFVYNSTLYFSTNGFLGYGGFDIFSANISSAGLQKAQNMGYGLNSMKDDISFVVFENGQKAYFSSNRMGNDDLFYTTIKKNTITIDGAVFADVNKTIPLSFATVVVLNNSTGEKKEITTDSLGRFTDITSINQSLQFSAMKDGYTQSNPIDFKTVRNGEAQSTSVDLVLMPDLTEISVAVNGLNPSDSLKSLVGFYISKTTGERFPIEKLKNGTIKSKVKPNDNYELFLTNKGYLDHSSNVKVGEDRTPLNLPAISMRKISKGVTFKIENIQYAYNDAKLIGNSTESLDRLIDFLKTNNNIRVEFSSHSDARGSTNRNQTLSSERSQSCVNYLISKGVPARQIVSVGYGESKPLNRCVDGVSCSEEEYAINRRTEVKILDI